MGESIPCLVRVAGIMHHTPNSMQPSQVQSLEGQWRQVWLVSDLSLENLSVMEADSGYFQPPTSTTRGSMKNNMPYGIDHHSSPLAGDRLITE